MNYISPTKTGATFGLMLGGLHLIWSVLVLIGWAQPFVDFSMWAHMAHFAVTVGPFDAVAAITVTVVAFLIGLVLGVVYGHVWNAVHKANK